MGATLKHKILTLALIFTAGSAVAGQSDLSTSSGDCVQCALAGAMNPPIAADKMPQRLPVSDTRKTFLRVGDGAQFNDVGAIRAEDEITVKTGNEDGELDGKTAKGHFVATAGLINPCWALTNYHAVLGDVAPPSDDPSKHRVSFYVGADASGTGFANKVSGSIKYVGDIFTPGKDQDFAIVGLDECPGNDSKIGFHDIAMIDASLQKGMTVTEVGYPDDLSGRDPKTMNAVAQKCVVNGYMAGNANISLTCRSRPGSSGSMIFAEKNGKKYVVAVATGGHALYDAHHKEIGFVTSAVSVAQIIRTVDDTYHVDFEAKTSAYNRQYAPTARPQDQGPAQLASK